MTHVSIKELTKIYPGADAPALDRLSLEIPTGELTALLGPSGCGKTTTMKMIAGLLEPTSGDVTFDGRSVLKDKPEHRGVVMVFQNYLLFPYMSVADNVGFGLKMRKTDPAEIKRRVAEMLELVKLPDLGDRKPSALSGGQQQRVALARALIVQPNVLLLDEPLSNLDAHLRFEMRDLIRSLQQEMGITTIFVTHDQEEAVVLADCVALILDGQMKQYDQPDAFYKRPVDEATARFFGGHNFIEGHSDGGVFESALGRLMLPDGAKTGGGKLTFRPENVRIAEAGAKENTLQARIADIIYMGTQTRLKLQVGETAMDAVVNPNEIERFAVGDDLPNPSAAISVVGDLMGVTFRSMFDVTQAEWLGGLGMTEDEIPDVVILEGSWWREERQAMRFAYLSEVRELDFPDIYWGRYGDKKIVFCMAYGAPRAVEVSQIFSGLGTKLVIQIGTCGGLQSHLAPGDIILPDLIRCEDGVAEHYVEGRMVTADPHWLARAKSALEAQDRRVHVGPHVTFASLFAESVEMYEAWHEQGLLSVEMEAATSLAAAAKFGVPGVAMVVVWDELTAGRRFMDPMSPEALKELEISNEAVYQAALTMVEEIT